ncbi:MAG: hypothetical protein EOR31_22795 [Mesorhizobium sp.]|nr:MAG: hypothetical protein EOR31_22795 [Mesorhizobium sp.]
MQSLPLTGRNYPVVGIIDGGVTDLSAIGPSAPAAPTRSIPVTRTPVTGRSSPRWSPAAGTLIATSRRASNATVAASTTSTSSRVKDC